MNGDNIWRVETYLVYKACPFKSNILFLCNRIS